MNLEMKEKLAVINERYGDSSSNKEDTRWYYLALMLMDRVIYAKHWIDDSVWEKKVDMMRILFCNIAWMKEYRGNEDGKDIPLNGGSYVDETGDAHEKYNFTPVNMEGREGLYCLGFFETKSHNGKDVNQMRIENISGCDLLKKEESVDDVPVVYCAKHPAHKFTTADNQN